VKIKVGPLLYDVVWVEGLKNDDGESLWGQAHHENGQINLSTGKSDSQTFVTLWHEVLHCFENAYGITLDEEMVMQLCGPIALAIMDNPALRGQP
jgi:hypothetical protein